MSSILKVDTIQDQSGNNIINESGNVITIGASGDTITVPAGATVSGFTSAGIDDNATSVAITIDSSERVGIGTTSPSRTLHVLSSAGTAQIQSTGTSSTLYFADTNSSTIDNQGVGSIGNNMFLMAGGSERMRITSDGKVGIGTSSPSSDASSDNILEIAGSTSPGLVINDTGQASKYSLHAVSADFVMNYGSTAFFRYKPGDSQITAHDNLKIITGTSSGVTPASFAEKLFIDGIGNQGLTIGTATSGIGTIAFGDSGDNDIGKIQYQHGDNSMLFVANAAERMRIDSSGNVGIKNTTMASFSNMPGTDLVVGGGTTHSGITIYSGTSSGSNIGFADGASGDARNQGIIQYHHNGDYMRFFTSASEKMRIDSSGNVGIGTSAPQSKLHILQTAETIDDGIKIVGSSSPVSGRIYMNSTDIHIDNATAGQNTGITLDTSGNVGIGTSSPSEKLDVNGTIKATGFNGANSPIVSLSMSSNQTTTDATDTLVALNTVDVDTDSAYTNSAGNYKFTVPSGKAGTYMITFMATSFTEGSDTIMAKSSIYKNGSVIAVQRQRHDGRRHEGTTAHWVGNLSVNDYIQFYHYHDTTSSSPQMLGGTQARATIIRINT